jgi:hypothetical protein
MQNSFEFYIVLLQGLKCIKTHVSLVGFEISIARFQLANFMCAIAPRTLYHDIPCFSRKHNEHLFYNYYSN